MSTMPLWLAAEGSDELSGNKAKWVLEPLKQTFRALQTDVLQAEETLPQPAPLARLPGHHLPAP